ncbi:hypothetical protein NC651_025207 [Populus alba x Populus x berolinensis]|nr:hypothetical protein NC651_025207 [Populus alba x Populus x berolinensis]
MNKILVSSHVIAGDSVQTTFRVLILINQDIDRRENLLICQMTGSLPNLMVKDSCC